MAPDAHFFPVVASVAVSEQPALTAQHQHNTAASRAAVLKERGIDAQELARVMAQNEAWAFPACEDGWVKAHNAVRLDMKDIGLALEAVLQRLHQGQAVQPWVISNLQRYWPKFEELVHHHHDNEEHLVVPELAKIGCVMPAKMSNDHVGLMMALDDLSATIKALQPGRPVSSDLAVFAVLKGKFDALRKDMEEHLLEEEEVCIPIMRKEVTQKRFKPIEAKIIKGATPDLLGWVLRAFPSDQARRQWMSDIAGIPGLVQTLVMMPALRKFRNQWTRLLEEVKAGERIAPEPTGCFGC